MMYTIQIHRLFQNNPPTKKQLHEIKMAAIRAGEIPSRKIHIRAQKCFGNCWAIECDFLGTIETAMKYGMA